RVVVGLFGGSFNPPHMGHVLAVTYLLSAGLVDRVLVVPVYAHALGKRLAPFEDRLEMARLAFAWLPRVEVSGIEQQLGTPSRTLTTVCALAEEHPDWELRLVVGTDILGELHQWHAWAEIERRAPPLVLPRSEPGSPRSSPPLLPEISSTDVRAHIAEWAEGKSDPAATELRRAVPRAVLEYVQSRGLYGVPAAPPI
ncbi:MAG TPA: nicotinate-nicotinamide nucleotide adenylyltransferase, partial [Polyangiaceae bacterium]|nr:nicotinate-nicotinamide nucleotide adenylyltransferase [Polyangiaceae bacterium]